jgi:hypothetical protein
MIKTDDEFTLIKDGTTIFAKAVSNNTNFLDTDETYKILLLCKLKETQLTVNFDKDYDYQHKEQLISRIQEYIIKFNIIEYSYFVVGFDKPTRTMNSIETQSSFHFDKFTPNADGNDSPFAVWYKTIVTDNVSDVTVLKYMTTNDRQVCSVQAFVMNSVRDDTDDPTTKISDSIRTTVCNGSIFFMRQKFKNLLLPHSTPFITSYFPTKSEYITTEQNKYNYYNHKLRSKGDDFLEDEINLGERIISRCQILNLTKEQYKLLSKKMEFKIIININFNIDPNNNVYDYDTYIADTRLRSTYEIGGWRDKKRQKKIKKKTMRRKKSRMKNHRRTKRH